MAILTPSQNHEIRDAKATIEKRLVLLNRALGNKNTKAVLELLESIELDATLIRRNLKAQGL